MGSNPILSATYPIRYLPRAEWPRPKYHNHFSCMAAEKVAVTEHFLGRPVHFFLIDPLVATLTMNLLTVHPETVTSDLVHFQDFQQSSRPRANRSRKLRREQRPGGLPPHGTMSLKT
jgi:hypothetical protein